MACGLSLQDPQPYPPWLGAAPQGAEGARATLAPDYPGAPNFIRLSREVAAEGQVKHTGCGHCMLPVLSRHAFGIIVPKLKFGQLYIMKWFNSSPLRYQNSVT